MDVSTVTPDILTERLDAEFYRPSFLENHRLLARLEKRSTLGEASTAIKLGYTGPIDDCYSTEGALFLTSKNISDGRVVVGPDTLRIRFDVHNGKLSSTIAKSGDLLFSRTGTVGKAAVLHDVKEHYNFAAHLFAVRVKAPFDSSYLGAFFSSRFGTLQSERMQRGTIIQGLSIYDMPGMTVPNHSAIVQKYIGDKMRQAERLGRDSVGGIDEARSALERLLAAEGSVEGSINGKDKKHQRVSSNMLADRIDGWYYKPEFLRIEAALNRIRSCGTSLIPIHQMGEVEYGFMPTEDYWARGEGAPLLRVTNIKENLVVDTSDLEYVNPVLSNKPRYRLRSGDVLCVQCGNSTGRIAFITDKFHDMVFPSFALRITNVGTDWDSAFLACFLASTIGQAQIQRTISITSVRPNTTKPAIEAVEVPKFTSEDQKRIGDAVRRGVTLREFVDPLCNAAKFLVEALLEKRISACELETAQKALECGDSSLDREILKRLTVLGIDIPGEMPLFPDIDAVYAAIQETKTAEPTNGDAP